MGVKKGTIPHNKGKSNGRKNITITILPELWKTFGEKCNERNVKRSDIIENFLREWNE